MGQSPRPQFRFVAATVGSKTQLNAKYNLFIGTIDVYTRANVPTYGTRIKAPRTLIAGRLRFLKPWPILVTEFFDRPKAFVALRLL